MKQTVTGTKSLVTNNPARRPTGRLPRLCDRCCRKQEASTGHDLLPPRPRVVHPGRKGRQGDTLNYSSRPMHQAPRTDETDLQINETQIRFSKLRKFLMSDSKISSTLGPAIRFGVFGRPAKRAAEKDKQSSRSTTTQTRWAERQREERKKGKQQDPRT